MRVSKLKIVISQLIFASCVSASMSGSALAGGFYYQGQYSNAFSQGNFAQYRFRPLTGKQPGHQQFATSPEYSRSYNQFAYRGYAPQQAFNPVYAQPQAGHYTRFSYRPVQPAGGYAIQERNMSSKASYIKPAFARQYAWNPAQPRGFRHGEAVNHYANQSSGTIEQADMSEYRSTPVTSQGFRYRAPTRNANYVSFTDRVNSSRPVIYSRPVQPELPPAFVAPSTAKADSFVANTRALTPGELLTRSGNFRFRPDERFQVKAQETFRNHPVAVPVDYNLVANAAIPETSDNSWNNWSFRPADTAF